MEEFLKFNFNEVVTLYILRIIIFESVIIVTKLLLLLMIRNMVPRPPKYRRGVDPSPREGKIPSAPPSGGGRATSLDG
jgi:hypothetical protein